MKSNNKSRGTGSKLFLGAALLLSLATNMNQVSATMNCL